MRNNFPDSQYVFNAPPKVNCYVEKTVFLEKHHITAKQSKFTSRMVNGHCEIVEHAVHAHRTSYRPRIPLYVICLMMLGLVIYFYNSSKPSTTSQTKIENTTTATVGYPSTNNINETDVSTQSEATYTPPTSTVSFDSENDILYYIENNVALYDGMIFPNSSSEEIPDDQLFDIQSKYPLKVFSMLIRMGVNEIYARHGYVFSKTIWATYYSNLSWYCENPYETIDFSYFNDTEIQNIKKILSIEESLK